MKAMTILATVFAASSAFAYPAVNDTATFAGTISNGVQSIQATVTLTITAYDASAQQYTLTQTADVQGQTQTQQAQVAASDLLTQATVLQIVGNCAAAGGVAEAVTVPAGTFNTCKLTQTSGSDYSSANVADVTFGFVKEVSFQASSNQTTIMEMQSHKAGN